MKNIENLRKILRELGVLRSELYRIMGVPKGTVDSWFSTGKISKWVWSWLSLYSENLTLRGKLRDMEITLKTFTNLARDEGISGSDTVSEIRNIKENSKSDTIGELLKHQKIKVGENIFFKDMFPDKTTGYFTAKITGETRKKAVIWEYDHNYYSISKLTQIIKNSTMPLNGTMYWVNKDGITLWEMR